MTVSTLGYRARVGIPLSALIVAVIGSAVNALIAWGGVSLGAAATGGLLPAAYIPATVVAAIGGAIGWHLINRYARDPRRVMRWLVPAFLVLSFIPDVIVGLSLGWLVTVTLMAMHVATITVGVTTYSRLMPLHPAGVPAPPEGSPA